MRLQRNVTQQELATEAGVSRPTVQGIEEGRPSQLVSVIRVLRALGIPDGLEQLVPEPGPSPIEMLEMQGEERQRAGGARGGRAVKGAGR